MKSRAVVLICLLVGLGACASAQLEVGVVNSWDEEAGLGFFDPSQDLIYINLTGEVYSMNSEGDYFSQDSNTGEVTKVAVDELSILAVEVPVEDVSVSPSVLSEVASSNHFMVSSGLRFQSILTFVDESRDLAEPLVSSEEIMKTHVALLEAKKSEADSGKSDPGILAVIAVAILAALRLGRGLI